jgi:hypothetical protein
MPVKFYLAQNVEVLFALPKYVKVLFALPNHYQGSICPPKTIIKVLYATAYITIL